MSDAVGNGNGEGDRRPPKDIQISLGGLEARYKWIPQDDITPKELAECLSLLLLSTAVLVGALPPPAIDFKFKALPEECQRHFVVEPRGEILKPKGIVLPG